MKKMYGSINNRLEENKMYCNKIQVGTGMTEYLYSDRKAYEVIEVKDQKHVTVRLYDHKFMGKGMTNDWKLVSNESNPTIKLTKRGDYWYDTITVTKEEYEEHKDNLEYRLWVALNGFDVDTILTKGRQTKYYKMNVSFGCAEYYYDYEF